jgi:hypothetical protein
LSIEQDEYVGVYFQMQAFFPEFMIFNILIKSQSMPAMGGVDSEYSWQAPGNSGE